MFFWVNLQNYVIKLLTLLAGCIVLGFGVYMEVLVDVVMLPGESFVRAIVQTWKTNFGTTKIIFDSSMTIIAGVLSVVFFGKLNGVREGTIIAALLVGFIARLFGKYLEFLKPFIFPKDYKTAGENAEEFGEQAKYKNVIVIVRQYGSGGHDIGKVLADKLGYAFYDQEIIKMAAGTTGMTSEFIRSLCTDFGMTTTSLCIRKRRAVCAADLPYLAPISVRTGFVKKSFRPSANGPQDSI